MEGDLRRIAFVTRRFGALQGLRWAGCGAAILIVVAVMQAVPGWTGDPRLQVFLFANTVLIFTPRVLDDYYGATFGTVCTGTHHQGDSRLGPRSQGPALAVMLGLAVDAMDFGIGKWVPGVAALACIGTSLWLLVRDWPHRPHYLLGVAGGIAAWSFAMQAPPSPDAFRLHPAAAAYYLTSCSLIGLVLLACGLLDHRLLATAMSSRNGARPEEESAGPYQGKLRAAAAAIAFVLCGLLFLRPVTAAATAGLTFLLLPLFMTPFLFWGLWRDMTWKFGAYSELTRAREARLLARITGDPAASGVPEAPEPPRVSPPDFFGHLVFPLLMAIGLVVDAAWRAHAFPSLAALALAASHTWIAVRDWPSRKHYLLGAVAGLAVAMSHIAIGSIRPMDWALRSVALISAVMLVEGLLDHPRESRHASIEESEAHADTV